jgi:hypothetical protein
MGMTKILVGAMCTENNEFVDLFVDLETKVVTFREEGEVRREVGYLYVENPLEVTQTDSIKRGITAKDYGQEVRGVIHCTDGRYLLTDTHAIKTTYMNFDPVGSPFEVDYNFEAEGGDEDEDEENY